MCERRGEGGEGSPVRKDVGSMTNRDRIMQELAAMSDRDLFRLLTEDHDNRLTDRLCHACAARHGGECPENETNCLLWDGSWLWEKWDGETLLEVVVNV